MKKRRGELEGHVGTKSEAMVPGPVVPGAGVGLLRQLELTRAMPVAIRLRSLDRKIRPCVISVWASFDPKGGSDK
jgi:hypothetical protein